MHSHPDIAHHFRRFPSMIDKGGPLGQNDTYGYALAAQPDQSQGRPTTNTGSQPTEQERPAHTCSQRLLLRTATPLARPQTPSQRNNTPTLT
jgi:hypothetical protein